MKDYISIPKSVLNRIADFICQKAEEANSNYVACSTELDDNGICYQITFNGHAFFRKDLFVTEPFTIYEHYLSSVVPTWMEVHTFDEEGEEMGNFFDQHQFTIEYLSNLA